MKMFKYMSCAYVLLIVIPFHISGIAHNKNAKNWTVGKSEKTNDFETLLLNANRSVSPNPGKNTCIAFICTKSGVFAPLRIILNYVNSLPRSDQFMVIATLHLYALVVILAVTLLQFMISLLQTFRITVVTLAMALYEFMLIMRMQWKIELLKKQIQLLDQISARQPSS